MKITTTMQYYNDERPLAMKGIAFQKNKKTEGFALIELIAVVAIITILAGVAFVGVQRYMRSMKKVEFDGYAKEIFVAAQNHLTMLAGQGYLGRTDNADFGQPETSDDVFHDDSNSVGNPDKVISLVLPFGSVDPTIWSQGYVIRYQRGTGQVLDVFYWEKPSGTRKWYQHEYSEGVDYNNFLTNKGNTAYLRAYPVDNSVIGYYGGAEAQKQIKKGDPIPDPDLKIVNDEILYAVVTLDRQLKSTEEMKLIIKGVDSGKSVEIPSVNMVKISDTQFIYVLDDITTSSAHFKEKFTDFTPGENIEVQATVHNNSELTNVGYSAKKRTNSLFDAVTTVNGKLTASVSRMRHLENLDSDISGISYSASDSNKPILGARQTKNLEWRVLNPSASSVTWSDPVSLPEEPVNFKERIAKIKILLKYAADSSTVYYGSDDSKGFYYPVNLKGVSFSYNGQGHSISCVNVETSVGAGLFDSVGSAQGGKSEIKNLKLIDFNIKSSVDGLNDATKGVGSLAGYIMNTDVNNVVAYYSAWAPSDNTPEKKSCEITASSTNTAAGGLIGSVGDSCNIEFCSASLKVTGGIYVGGLIGCINGTQVTLNGCYSGGHTISGGYFDTTDRSPIYSIISNNTDSGIAGGLVGKANNATINNSYSTCAVFGNTCGGFVGQATGVIKNCYETGIVSGSNAFIGSGPLDNSSANNYYYSIIHEKRDPESGMYDYKSPGDTHVSAFDKDAVTYNGFAGNPAKWAKAEPYDEVLEQYYQNHYPLKSIGQLNSAGRSSFVSVHYGDWPAPEVFVLNNSISTTPPSP